MNERDRQRLRAWFRQIEAEQRAEAATARLLLWGVLVPLVVVGIVAVWIIAAGVKP